MAILAAYLAAAASVPALYLTLTNFWFVPTPVYLRSGSLVDIYLVIFVAAAFCGLPGFILARLGLWWFKVRSPIAFAVAGSLAGALAAVRICYPYNLEALRTYNLDVMGVVIGVAAGLIYWKVEHLLTGRRGSGRKTPNPGETIR